MNPELMTGQRDRDRERQKEGRSFGLRTFTELRIAGILTSHSS